MKRRIFDGKFGMLKGLRSANMKKALCFGILFSLVFVTTSCIILDDLVDDVISSHPSDIQEEAGISNSNFKVERTYLSDQTTSE